MLPFVVLVSVQPRQTLQRDHSFALFARSFAPERSASPFPSIISALLACLPGVASRAQIPISELVPIAQRSSLCPSFNFQLPAPSLSGSTFDSPLSPLDSALTDTLPVSPLESALTEKPERGGHVAQPLLAVLRRATVDPQTQPEVGSRSKLPALRPGRQAHRPSLPPYFVTSLPPLLETFWRAYSYCQQLPSGGTL